MTTTLIPTQGTKAIAPVAAPTSLEALFAEQRPRLLQLARTMVHCPHAAEDVVQDGMLAAFAAWSSFEGRAGVGTWLHRIVVNAALMHLRRQRCRRETDGSELDATMVGDAVDPATAAEGADAGRRLRACLAELSPDHRNVIEMRDIRGLSTAAVAATLGISENATKIRLHRARRRLRDVFEAAPGQVRVSAPAVAAIVAMPRRRAGDSRVAG